MSLKAHDALIGNSAIAPTGDEGQVALSNSFVYPLDRSRDSPAESKLPRLAASCWHKPTLSDATPAELRTIPYALSLGAQPPTAAWPRARFQKSDCEA